MRPGEKLYEELLIGDDITKTANPLIMRAKEDMISWNELKKLLDDLSIFNMRNDWVNSREILKTLVPDFKSEDEIKDILYLSKTIN